MKRFLVSRLFTLTCLLLIMVMVAASSHAASTVVRNKLTTATLTMDATSVKPGDSFWAMMTLQIKPGWHTYWQNPGDSGMATRMDWALPEGWTAGEIRWPTPKRTYTGTLASYGYADFAFHPVRVTVSPQAKPGSNTLKMNAEWLVCKEICIPEFGSFSLPVMVGEHTSRGADADLIDSVLKDMPMVIASKGSYSVHTGLMRIRLPDEIAHPTDGMIMPMEGMVLDHASAQKWIDGSIEVKTPLNIATKSWKALWVDEAAKQAVQFEVTPASPPKVDAGLWKALIFALIGGFILNAMPCVFPVLSLKALALAKKAHLERREALMLAGAYTVGVVVSFWIVAGILVALRQAGQQIGWGYHMQSSAFVLALSLLLFLVGLSLSGLMEIPSRFAGLGSRLASGQGLRASFFTGVLATLVATPCTAPFMAPAIGYALLQSTPMVMTVFTMLGIGLALPYLLIGIFPAMLRMLPKPGPWMDRFKQFLAFPMYASSLWLLWVLSQQAGATALGMAMLALLMLVFICWWWPLTRSWHPAMRAGLLILCLGPVFGALSLSEREMTIQKEDLVQDGVPYSEQALRTLRIQEKPVLLDATAAWCITCKVNERVAIKTPAVQALMKERGITFMVADWTNQDPAITRLLQEFGRSGVPMVVFYPPKGAPKLLPEILTESIVLSELDSF
jgi:thiol:disulfide interchange protein DsbD